ncbi:phosphatase PAP2 family protein [bacterium]|nr:phosphatase PAP2 family protein [bacterium]
MSFQLILEKIAGLDTALFYFINDTLYCRPIADATFLMANDRLLLALLLAGVVVYGFISGWKKSCWLALWGTAAVVICNLLQNLLLKPFFNRPRPYMVLSEVHLCVPLKNLAMVSSAFPSTHAAAAAALAIVARNLDRHLSRPAFIFAFLIGAGTVYSGGHYPGDVIAGYGVGILIGWGLTCCHRMIRGSVRGGEQR